MSEFLNNAPTTSIGGVPLVFDTANTQLMAYLRSVMEWHGYVKFIQLPRDNPDIRLSDIFTEPLIARSPITPQAAEPNEEGLQTALDSLAAAPRTVLLGDPGSGKSTFVSWIACQLAINASNSYKEMLGQLLPIPMVLREMDIRPGIAWETLIDRFLGHLMVRGIGGARDLVESALSNGQAFLLFDGVDEIGSSDLRRELREAICQGMRSSHANCRWLITSRIVGYEDVPFDPQGVASTEITNSESAGEADINSVGITDRNKDPIVKRGDWRSEFGITLSYVAPFDNTRISSYAYKWFALRDYSADRASLWAEEFVAALHSNSDMIALARNPNMLSLAALIYRVRARLPHGRAELYREIVEAYVQAIDEYRGLLPGQDFPAESKRKWLARIAFEMQKRRDSDKEGNSEQGTILAAEEELRAYVVEAMRESRDSGDPAQAEGFLSFIKRRSGLLIPRGASPDGQEMFAFVHLSIQEYLAAVYMQDQVCTPRWLRGDSSAGNGADRESIRRYANNSIWLETLVLLFEVLKENTDWTEELADTLFGPDFGNLPRDDSSEVPATLLARLVIDTYSGFSEELISKAYMALSRLIAGRNRAYPPCEPIKALFSGSRSGHPDVWNRLQASPEFLETRILSLSNCNVDDLGPLANLTELATLALDFSQVTDLGPLGALTQLSFLDFDHTRVSDLRPLAGLTMLSYLYLSDTHVTDLRPLAGLAEVRHLELNDTNIADLKPLANLIKLQELHLSNTQVTDLRPLANLTILRDLSADGTPVTDLKPLANLTHLWYLNLRNTHVTDLRPLAKLAELQRLYLDNTQVTDLSPLATLTKLQALELSHTHVTDLSPLAKLANLQRLHLDSSQVTDLGPLAKLAELQELYLDSTQVTDLSPLASLSELKDLYLRNTQLTDLSPLSNLAKLKSLYLPGARALDLGPLANLKGLVTLDLDNPQSADLRPLAGLKNTRISISATLRQ